MVGISGFAFAVARDYVIDRIDVDAIRASIDNVSFSVGLNLLLTTVSVTYHLQVSSGPTVTFAPGAIEIAATIKAHTATSWAPDGYLSFKQRLALVFNYAEQDIRLQRIGDPEVDESWFIPHGLAVGAVRAQIDAALSANSSALGSTLSGAKQKLVNGLHTFDAAADASFTAVEITPDGIVVRGDISGAPRRPPVSRIAATMQGSAVTALESWVPAGRIDRFVWTWVEYSSPSIWSGVQKTLVDEHRFMMPKPVGVGTVDQICLRIEGTQFNAGGWSTPVRSPRRRNAA